MTHRSRLLLSLGLFLLILFAVWRLIERFGPEPEAARVQESEVVTARAEPPESTETPQPADSDPRPDAGGVARELGEEPLWLPSATVRRDPTTARGALAGRVVSWGSGKGVSGARLLFAHGGATEEVRTGDHGGFEYEPAEPGVHSLTVVTAQGYLPFAPAWGHSPIDFHPRPGERIEGIQVYLRPAVEYVGVVLDPEGEPVEGAEGRLLGADTGETALMPLEDRFVSDASGEFRFRAPDGVLVEARHPEHGAAREVVDLAVQASHRMILRLGSVPEEAGATEHIAGRVLDAEGDPVADALVRAALEVEPTEAGRHPAGQAVSGADGAFRLEGLDAGRHTVVAQREGFARAGEEGVEAGTDDLDLVLGPERILQGTVRDGSTGQPIPAFTVVVLRPKGPLEKERVRAQSTYDPEGEFAVGGLGSGTYEVLATARGYAPSEPAAVTLDGDGASIELALSQGGRLEGVVRDARNGEPLEGARVSLEGMLGGGSAVPLLAATTTGAAGRFELSGVAPGRRSISVVAEGHHGRILSGLRIAPGSASTVEVELTPTEEGERPRLELAGIGAVLAARDEALYVGRVIEGGGAAEVGLTRGDAILAVDGQPVTEVGFEGAIQRIRGPEGSTVRLRVRRAETDEVETLAVPRRRVSA